VQQQVTDVIALTRMNNTYREDDPRIPLWLKVAWTAWVLIWAPLYWRYYGPQNFLYFCDLGNLLIAVGLWTESRLILSWQAVGLLVFQTLYALDLIAALLFGKHLTGGTEYMFDPAIPLPIRLLGLYHLVVPVLLLWAVRRLGYDPNALKYQVFATWIIVPINYFWRPEYNVNFARGIGREQHLVPGWIYLLGYLVLVPVVVYWPTDWALARWAAKSNRFRP
jgi:hypothetical protein